MLKLNNTSSTLFTKHNFNNFQDIYLPPIKKGLILVEFHAWCSAHICYSYLLNSLKKKYKCKIYAYEGYTLISSSINQSVFQKFKWTLGQEFNLKNFGVYKSLGVETFIRPKVNSIIEKKLTNFFNKKKHFSSKSEILKTKINGILIGDLIYDTYLKIYKIPTINLNDKNFYDFFSNSLKLFFYWYEYFRKNLIKAVVISHSTYLHGMIMRIANSFSINVYKPTFNGIYNIRKKNYTIGQEFFQFKKTFNNLTNREKKNGIIKAKKELDSILVGKSKAALGYNFKLKKIIKKNKKKSTKPIVLIAMHSFYDSPHVFGKMLFPDFFEWLNHIVNLSLKTDYKWYLKLHPENNRKDLKFISSILKKNKNIIILPAKTNHRHILNLGVNFLITCFGSIGFEYAYQDVTVINACTKNPHANYNFNLNPKTIKIFNNIIINLKKFKLKINKTEILEFFFTRRFLLRINWLKLEKNKIEKGFGWDKSIYQPKMYNLWIYQWNKKKHQNIIQICDKFVNSNMHKMNQNHLVK